MPFIILDRDGVINQESTEYIKSADEWHPIPGSLEAIAQLNRCGYRVIIATNQSGVARGLYNLETLESIHKKLKQELARVGGHVDEIFFCPHQPNDQCICRKPKPGLLFAIAKKYRIDLSETFFIGDSCADMTAAKAAACKPILVLTGKGEATLKKCPAFSVYPHFRDLAGAVAYVLSITRYDDA